jgi:hypothetical protein
VLWIVLSWALFVVLLVVGVAGFAGGLVSTINDSVPTTTFASGATVNAALDPAAKPAIYAASNQPVDVHCQVQGAPGQKITLKRPGASQTVTFGDVEWEVIFEVGVPAAGTYQVTCDGDGVRFGIGKSLLGNAGKLVGGTIALLGLPAIGFLLAVVVTIVVLVRRSSARRSLMEYQRGPYTT